MLASIANRIGQPMAGNAATATASPAATMVSQPATPSLGGDSDDSLSALTPMDGADLSKAIHYQKGLALDTNNMLVPFLGKECFHGCVHLFKDENGKIMPDCSNMLLNHVVKHLSSSYTKTENHYMIGACMRDWQSYLRTLFNGAVKDKVLHSVFNTKRSNLYGAMKVKFQGK